MIERLFNRMSAIGHLFPSSLSLSTSLPSFSFFNFPDAVNFSFLKILLYISKAVKLYPIFYEESLDHLLIFLPVSSFYVDAYDSAVWA